MDTKFTYSEMRVKLDEYCNQKSKKIRKNFAPQDENFSERFRRLGEEMAIIEHFIRQAYGWADENTDTTMHPVRMD